MYTILSVDHPGRRQLVAGDADGLPERAGEAGTVARAGGAAEGVRAARGRLHHQGI